LLAAGDGTGPQLAAWLAALGREEADLRRQLADLDAGLPPLRQELSRRADAVRQVAAAAASAARVEALDETAGVEGTLAGLPGAAGEALDAIALALLHKADTEALLYRPEVVGAQVARELAGGGYA
jgi:hypothetical protein